MYFILISNSSYTTGIRLKNVHTVLEALVKIAHLSKRLNSDIRLSMTQGNISQCVI